MVATSVNTSPYLTNTLPDSFQAKAAKFKEITGRKIAIEKNNDGDFIHMFHPDSTQRLSFMGEFFRVGFNSPDGFEAAVENLAGRFVQLREELMERYGDNQDELYKQLSKLNQSFESALQSTVLLPLQAPPLDGIISSDMPQSVRNSIKREWQEHENIIGFMQTFKHNMSRHIDAFFETFIKSIQGDDFDSAFASSMEKLNSDESRSLSDMSFRDAVAIRDALMQGRFEKDKNDEGVFIFNRPIDSLRSITIDTRISETIRRELAELMGFAWRGGEQ